MAVSRLLNARRRDPVRGRKLLETES